MVFFLGESSIRIVRWFFCGWSSDLEFMKREGKVRKIVDMAGRSLMIPEVIDSVFTGSMYGYAILASLKPEVVAAVPMLPRPADKRILHQHLHNLPLIEKITDVEMLKKVKPDLVIVWADTDQPFHKKSEEVLDSLKIPFVYVTVPGFGDLSGFPAAYEFLGNLLDCAGRAKALAEYCRKNTFEISAVVEKIPDNLRPAVYYAEDEDGLATEFDDSFHAHLLRFLGNVNVHRGHLDGHKGMERISFEQLADYNPDVIIAWRRSFCQKVLHDPSWAKIRAVKNRRVYPVPDIPFSWFDRPPCFMRIIGVRWLASILYPDHFKPDIIKDVQDFYYLFLNQELTSDEASQIMNQEYE